MDGGFADHPGLGLRFVEQSGVCTRQYIECAGVAAESREYDPAIITRKTFGADVGSALHDGGTGVQVACDFQFVLFQSRGNMSEGDGPKLHFIHASSAQRVMGFRIMIAGDPDGLDGACDVAQTFGI